MIDNYADRNPASENSMEDIQKGMADLKTYLEETQAMLDEQHRISMRRTKLLLALIITASIALGYLLGFLVFAK